MQPVTVKNYYLAYPSTTQQTTERMECNTSSTESYAIHEDHLVLTWIWLLTFLLYCDNNSWLLSLRNGESKFLIKDTRYKATFYFCCDLKKSHILQIKCRTLKYWHSLIMHNAEVLLQFTLKLQLKMYKKEKKKKINPQSITAINVSLFIEFTIFLGMKYNGSYSLIVPSH